MALVSSSGTPFDKRLVKNNSGAILNVTESENFDDLTPSKSSHGPKRVSGPVLRDGDVGETTDRAGVQRADSSKPFAKKPESNIVYGAGVNEKLNSRDYSGSLNDDATEENRIITGTSEAGSGVLNKFNILSRPDAKISSGRTKAANAGSKKKYLNPTTGSGVAPSTISKRRNTGKLRWSFGGIPQLISYASRDQAESIPVFDEDGNIVAWIPISSYPEDGIHEDAFIFEIDTTPTGGLLNPFNFSEISPAFSPSGFRLPTAERGYYDCVVDWGDGTTTEFKDTSHEHIIEDAPVHFYSSPGTYEIKISGDFRGIGAKRLAAIKPDVLGSFDIIKITKIKRWGTKLRLYPDWGNGLYYDANAIYGWLSASNYKDTGNAVWNGYTLPKLNNGANKPKGISHLPKYCENYIKNLVPEDNKIRGNGDNTSWNSYYNLVLHPVIEYNEATYDVINGQTWWLPTAISGIDETGAEDATIEFYSYVPRDINIQNGKIPVKNNSFTYSLSPTTSFVSVDGWRKNEVILESVFNNAVNYELDVKAMENYYMPNIDIKSETELIDPNDNLYNLSGWKAPEVLLGFNENHIKSTSATTDYKSVDQTIWGKCKNIDLIDFSNTRVLSGFGSYSYYQSNRYNTITTNSFALDLTSQTLPDLNNIDFKNIDHAFGLFSYLKFPVGYTGISNLSLTGVKSINGVFYGSENIPDINNWTFGNLESSGLHHAFRGSKFNGDISNWIPQVDGIESILEEAPYYNHPSTTGWNLTGKTSLKSVFNSAISFNQPIGNWDTSNITNTDSMFFKASAFNQDLTGWDFSNVSNAFEMFRLATAFNGDISTWNTSSLTEATRMFHSCSNFNSDISNWDTSSLQIANNMFQNASSFNSNISNWNLTNLASGDYMLYGTSFNSPVNWDLTNVKSSFGIFPTGYSASLTGLTPPVSGRGLFAQCYALDSSLSSLDISNVRSLEQWLYGARNIPDITSWEVGHITNFAGLFDGVNNYFNQNISSWNVSSGTNFERMLKDARIFNQPIGNWDVSNSTSFSNMFYRAFVFNQDISNWNTSQATNMNGMFSAAQAFNQDISNWDTSNVTNMNTMFSAAFAFNKPIGNWDVSNVTRMNTMFSNAQAFNQDISNWNVSNVTDMAGMFSNTCPFNGDISNWDTRSLVSFHAFARNNTTFNCDISNWNTSGVTSLNETFYGASSFNQPIGNWNTSNCYDFSYAFYNATSFDQDISNWDFNHEYVSSYGLQYMFYGCNLSPANYDALLLKWFSQADTITKNQINVNMGTSRYTSGSAAANARASLVNDYGWSITDGGAI